MNLTKHYLVIVWIFLLLFVSGCKSQNNASDTQSRITATSENMRITEISLPGMFCPFCVRSAENAFRQIYRCTRQAAGRRADP